MFKDLSLKPSYDSYNDNIAKSFYIPILKESILFYRITGYFSSKVLAYYSQGLEYLAKKNGKYKIITSINDLSEFDYNQIIKGLSIRNEIINRIEKNIRYEELTENEKNNFSNLAFLISIGLVEIKIAFTKNGIFHDKIGYCVDEYGNSLSFCGSNNETLGGIKNNFESFDVTCDWLSSSFDRKKIDIARHKFQELWENRRDDIWVLDIPQIIKNKILSYSKEGLFENNSLIKPDIVLDLSEDENNLIIVSNNTVDYINHLFFHRYYRRKIQKIEQNILYLNNSLNYLDYKELYKKFINDSVKCGYMVICSKKLSKYIEKHDLFISERSRVGIEIKNKDKKYEIPFEDFKTIVTSSFERVLRNQQMWDAFYLYIMRKAGNFSVPGSGKTSELYGVFSVLLNKDYVNKIVMIGPKSSFKSWIDEFKICFGNKLALSYYIYDSQNYKKQMINKNNAFRYKYNLILINYEAFPTNQNSVLNIIDSKTMLVYDEVHKVKSVTGVRATSCLELSKKVKYMYVLTGTPVPNSYLDLYNLLHFLFPVEYDNFFSFDIGMLKNPNPDDIDLINSKIKPFYCRTTKEQLEVPPANQDNMVNCFASEEEVKLFDIINSYYRRRPLARIVRILQLETNPNLLLSKINLDDFKEVLDLVENYSDNNEEYKFDYFNKCEEIKTLVHSIDITTKFKTTLSLIKKNIKEGRSIIIWTIFKDSSLRLVNTMKELGINAQSITGDIDNELRVKYIEDFRNNKFQVLVTNPQTLAESVSLHNVCHYAIYYEFSYNLVHLLQSKDRIHRLGLKEGQETDYDFIILNYNKSGKKFSLDKNIYDRLKKKELIMKEAISNQKIEGMPSTDEDIKAIFSEMNLIY